MENKDNFYISDDIVKEGDFIYIEFSVECVDYLFSAHLEDYDDNGYQITFDSIENIKNQNSYEPMPPKKVTHFFTRIFEYILEKIFDSVGGCYFFAIPAGEKLGNCYRKLADRYNNKESLFVVSLTKVSFEENCNEYECYNIKKR